MSSSKCRFLFKNGLVPKLGEYPSVTTLLEAHQGILPSFVVVTNRLFQQINGRDGRNLKIQYFFHFRCIYNN